MPTSLPITGRPIRLGVVGLGQISELVLPSYLGRDDVIVDALFDTNPERLARSSTVFPHAHPCSSR